MEMQAAARRVGQRLGHGAEDQAVLLRHRMRGELEQHVAVRRRKRIIKLVVDFVLAACVLMVDLLQVKAQFGER